MTATHEATRGNVFRRAGVGIKLDFGGTIPSNACGTSTTHSPRRPLYSKCVRILGNGFEASRPQALVNVQGGRFEGNAVCGAITGEDNQAAVELAGALHDFSVCANRIEGQRGWHATGTHQIPNAEPPQHWLKQLTWSIGLKVNPQLSPVPEPEGLAYQPPFHAVRVVGNVVRQHAKAIRMGHMTWSGGSAIDIAWLLEMYDKPFEPGLAQAFAVLGTEDPAATWLGDPAQGALDAVPPWLHDGHQPALVAWNVLDVKPLLWTYAKTGTPNEVTEALANYLELLGSGAFENVRHGHNKFLYQSGDAQNGLCTTDGSNKRVWPFAVWPRVHASGKSAVLFASLPAAGAWDARMQTLAGEPGLKNVVKWEEWKCLRQAVGGEQVAVASAGVKACSAALQPPSTVPGLLEKGDLQCLLGDKRPETGANWGNLVQDQYSRLQCTYSRCDDAEVPGAKCAPPATNQELGQSADAIAKHADHNNQPDTGYNGNTVKCNAKP